MTVCSWRFPVQQNMRIKLCWLIRLKSNNILWSGARPVLIIDWSNEFYSIWLKKQRKTEKSPLFFLLVFSIPALFLVSSKQPNITFYTNLCHLFEWQTAQSKIIHKKTILKSVQFLRTTFTIKNIFVEWKVSIDVKRSSGTKYACVCWYMRFSYVMTLGYLKYDLSV